MLLAQLGEFMTKVFMLIDKVEEVTKSGSCSTQILNPILFSDS